MFEIKNVSKKYGDEFALNNVSMNIGKGLNFIVGASGSGKTTLLKIISGMEQDFEGEVFYCGKDIKNLTGSEKSYFYNNIFGFVWQDFNLIEENTVLENVLLPCYLKNQDSRKNAEKILKDLKIHDLAKQKVKYLSGGQKQRVAIVRELMKNPQVIIADEPTSALDGKSSKTTMEILRVLAKSRTVIVVTHDTSLITNKDQVFELDKGELVSKPEIGAENKSEVNMKNKHKVSFTNSGRIALSNIKNKPSHFIVSVLTLLIASVLLLTTVSGAISKSSQGEFDKLYEDYGPTLTDIIMYSNFIDSAGTGDDTDKKPIGQVKQDIGKIYDLYKNDERVDFIAYTEMFDDIKIKVDGKEHTIETARVNPVLNDLVAGKMPMGDGNEIVVPESFVKKLGITPEEAIGKEIDFNAVMYTFSGESAIANPISTPATIVGVMDSVVRYTYEGKIPDEWGGSYNMDSFFLFNKPTLEKFYEKVGIDISKKSFTLRPKTPADMISLKNEMNKKGIIPTGRFELVEDIVKLNNQTMKQSGSASLVIGILSIVMVIAIFLITGLLRKREYAIYKVSGYNNRHLSLLTLSETMLVTISAVILMLAASPLLNLVTQQLFGVYILSGKMLFTGTLLILLTSIIAYVTSILPFSKTNPAIALKAGEH